MSEEGKRTEQDPFSIPIDTRLIVQEIEVAPPGPNLDVPIKGGPRAERAADDAIESLQRLSPGMPLTHREVYVLANTEAEGARQYLVLRTGESGQELALPVFTDRDHAVHYRQDVHLVDYQPVPLSPQDLAEFLRDAPSRKVSLIAVDPRWLAQFHGEPQPALSLKGLTPDSAEQLYRDIYSTALEPTV